MKEFRWKLGEENHTTRGRYFRDVKGCEISVWLCLLNVCLDLTCMAAALRKKKRSFFFFFNLFFSYRPRENWVWTILWTHTRLLALTDGALELRSVWGLPLKGELAQRSGCSRCILMLRYRDMFSHIRHLRRFIPECVLTQAWNRNSYLAGCSCQGKNGV